MHLRRKGKVPGCKPRSKDRDGESKELRQRQTHYAKGAGLSGDGALNFTHYSPAFSQARYSRRVQEALGSGNWSLSDRELLAIDLVLLQMRRHHVPCQMLAVKPKVCPCCKLKSQS